jgi:uroporphyrin-III C-methyltransferase
LLTLAARDLLATADTVFHDALVEPGTLALCDPEAELVDVGKRAGRPNPTQESITARMIRAAGAGKIVVRLKGGDPFLFGRGGEELADLIEAGIDTVVVPGVSSVMAAPAVAGIPLTYRGVAASVAVVTARSRNASVNLEQIQSAARAVDTLVVLMPLGRLADLVAGLIEVLGAERPAALVSGATTRDERTVRAPLRDIAEAARTAGIVAPATLIVGEVVTAIPPALAGSQASGSTPRG